MKHRSGDARRYQALRQRCVLANTLSVHLLRQKQMPLVSSSVHLQKMIEM
jgi:hypothetical protein